MMRWADTGAVVRLRAVATARRATTILCMVLLLKGAEGPSLAFRD
jgi:hypothetical protein